jgi:hypothetical protein
MHAKQSVARSGNAPPYPPFSSDDPKSGLASQSGVTMPKSTSMSVDNSGSMDPESHRGTTSQEWPSYPTIDRKAPFDEPPIDAAGTGPVGASSQQLRTRDPHFEDHRTPTVPIPASSSHQMTANRKDFGGPEAELDIRPRDSQVRTTLASSACARDPHRQPFTAASCWCRQLSKCGCTPHFLLQPI